MRSFIFYTKHRISFLSILPLAFFTLFCVAPVFSLPEHPFNLQLSLGTSANLYGDENINSYRTQYFSSDTSRFVLNGEVGTGFFLDEYISLNFGGIVSFDWFKHAFYADDGSGRVITDSMFPLDYDIFFGVRIFPFLLGFAPITDPTPAPAPPKIIPPTAALPMICPTLYSFSSSSGKRESSSGETGWEAPETRNNEREELPEEEDESTDKEEGAAEDEGSEDIKVGAVKDEGSEEIGRASCRERV